MEFKVSVNLDNAAFEGGFKASELADTLREVARLVEAGSEYGAIRDISGNTIGHFEEVEETT